jgi:hypothetical protein
MGIDASAQWHGSGSNQDRPVYQRRAFEWSRNHGKRRDDKFGHQVWRSPPVNAGWFQRPYPYHLDYYKMRYGGSYAPYFGNLYGPPQVVTAPPYYGPYYGGYVNPDGGGYATPIEPPTNFAPPIGGEANGDTLPMPQP